MLNPIHFIIHIAVATSEADEATSDFLKIMGISLPKWANQGDSGHFWLLHLVW